MFIILALLGFTLAQTQECIFYTPDARHVRQAVKGGACTPSDSSELAQNECCTANDNGGPSCSFQQRAGHSLPEWYEDPSSKTATSSTCFVAGGDLGCHWFFQDGTDTIYTFDNHSTVKGGLSYDWEAGCIAYRTGKDQIWYPQCHPQKIGTNADPPKITQIPKKVEFRGSDDHDVYQNTLYCYQEKS